MTGNVERVNWVMRMHNCKIERVLDTVFGQVRIDLKERQKLTDAEDGISFTIDDMRSEKRMFVVNKVSICEDSDDVVPIAEVKYRCARDKHEDFIAVSRCGGELKITRKWNSETATCDYFVEGKPAVPWQISNAALRSLFF